MKNKRLILRIFACILVCSLSLTVFQPLSVFSEQSTQVAESKPEKWVPSEEDMRLPNTKGDLTLEQLETAQLSAEDIPEYISQESIEEKGHVNRLREQENDDNTVIFQNRDGTKTVYFFSNPVKYTDENGNKKDKKTKLDSKNIPEKYSDKYGYVNQDNDIKTYFPKQITSNQGMLLESKDISIELIPIDAVEKKYVLQNGSILTPGEYLSENKTASVKSISNISVNSNIAKINTEKLSVQKASANKVSVTDEKTNYPKDTVQYNGVFGNKTNLRYSATFEGFKEDIILYENTGVNSFRFKLKTNGLSLVCGEDEQYYLSNPLSGERLAAIGELIVYDSNNKKYKNDQGKEYNHHYEVTTVKADDEYILTVVLDEEFLNSSDTVYPVYIDPAVTIMPQSSVKTAAIYSNGKVFANDSSEVKIGYTNYYGTGRGLYDFPILNFNQDFMFLYGNQISSATLNLYAQPYSYENTSPDDAPKTLTMYEFHSPWSPYTVKWNNTDPNNYGSPISSVNVTSGWTSFDIFNIIQRYKSSSDDMSDFEGVIIKADTETSGTWKKFVSSYGESDLRPYISMTYNDNQAACPQVVSGATYYLKNYNNKYLDVYNANTTNNTKLRTCTFDGDANQQFKITHISGGEYEISPQHTTEKVLSVNSSGQVIIEEDCNRSRQRWYIYYRNGRYHIVNKQYNTGVMAPTYDTDYVSINDEYDCCCWELEKLCGDANYCDVTRHNMQLLNNGYYRCLTCQYRIKSPVLQDKEVLTTEDYLKVISCLQASANYMALKEDGIGKVYIEPGTLLKIIDEIRSQSKYNNKYQYQDNSGNCAPEFHDFYDDSVMLELFIPSINCHNVTSQNLLVENGLLEGVVEFIGGFFVPKEYLPFYIAATSDSNEDIIFSILSELAKGAGMPTLGIIIDLISLELSIDYELLVGDKVVYISSGFGMEKITAKFVYSSSGEFKKSEYSYTTSYIIA